MTDFSPKSVIRWGLDFWGKVVSENAHWIQEMEHESSENHEVRPGKNKKQQEARKHCKNCGQTTEG